MEKPIKPIKPSKNDSPPSEKIKISKMLVLDKNKNQFFLIDEKSHPDVFPPEEYGPCGEKLYELNLEWYFKKAKYSDYKKIEKDCISDLEDSDFCLDPLIDQDGYYICSYLIYEIKDKDYNKKIEAYNKRFENYEKDLKKYEKDLEKYKEYKKEEKKKNLEEQLKKLK